MTRVEIGNKTPSVAELAIQDMFGEVMLADDSALVNNHGGLGKGEADLTSANGNIINTGWCLARLRVMPWLQLLALGIEHAKDDGAVRWVHWGVILGHRDGMFMDDVVNGLGKGVNCWWHCLPL